VVGLETATLNLNSDAVGSPMQISLAGIGQTLVKSLITTTPALLFGAQNIGTTSLQQNARAAITGTATVTFSAPTITGTNAADFAVSFNGCTTLIVGTCVVQVTFTPSFAGLETATLNINSDAVGSPMQINLAGIGQTLVKSLSTSTPALLFPAQNIGTTSSFQNARAIDTGNATVTFSAPTITGTSAADFAISFNSCTTLAPGAGGCNVQITFTPSLAGIETATLNLASDAIGSPIQISLTGIGQTVVKSVSVTPSLTYAAQNVGTDSGVQNVFVINTGTTLVTFSPFSITGTNSGDFVIHANNCTGTLAPTVSCNVAIIFHPTATGSRTANLQVASDAVGSPQPVILTGTGQ
jgi:hypothetical protein